ncbi:TPA: DUF4231 domain-containing protein [Pasteurella multocida]|uniref:DUF4231 domain-containing protein n=1 Tax=Pasteurella multocida TaxID=747 RepID=UPI0028DEDA9D|nr:DUF4231 domain-containing protein [Pasteurella multocida]MEB3484553.1 DUF4231 domain-containing protein [Pasteurella multocida]MEB3495009.1 DUF4231 domain-containing protein [Pasteurella multocida]HDR0967238.1 DUF4231 domain-containing protein [Pasteurella multocida]HDR0970145.1 DUF4231 domain-containing protein [Pasteurella multocida]HDR0994489.1 DUF4231 domain-containing protein [Pasteurella multocida]
MTEQDFPALYRSADKLSLDSQKYFFRALFIHLSLLVAAAVLSMPIFSGKWVAIAQLLALTATLGCSIYLATVRPDRYWYAGRAVAESVKTITWRYVSRAEPFNTKDEIARSDFQQSLSMIFNQNRDVGSKLIDYSNEGQFTEIMEQMRKSSLDIRKENYNEKRIKEQRNWYAKKANFNKKMGDCFFWGLVIINFIAIILAVLKISCIDSKYLPVDLVITLAASLLSWIQAKRFTELSASYALTAHEIGFINEQSALITTESKFSKFVGDAENAFSREHTQWAARRDV